MRSWVFITVLGLLSMLVSCKKNKPLNADEPVVQENYDSLDAGIRFNRYESGVFYATDTLQNEFVLTNHSGFVLKKGTIFKTACRINGVLFALDLIGEGPTNVPLDADLAPGASVVYNPGYLLRQPLLDYFGKDTISVCVLVYGVNGVSFTPPFASDPVPSNNTACMEIYSTGLRVQ